MFGRLGTGSVTDELLPVKVPIKMDGREKENPSGNTNFDNVKQHQDVKITAIAAGAYHNLALSDEGSVWSWGYNVCILLCKYAICFSFSVPRFHFFKVKRYIQFLL